MIALSDPNQRPAHVGEYNSNMSTYKPSRNYLSYKAFVVPGAMFAMVATGAAPRAQVSEAGT